MSSILLADEVARLNCYKDVAPDGSFSDEHISREDGLASREDSAEVLPLFPPLPPAASYPVQALGPVLGQAASAIASKVQVPLAMAAQSVLATASLAAQPHA